MTKRGLTFLIAVGVVALAAAQAKATGATLVVDDDRQQCPAADFTSINAAIAVSRPGREIKVCPGTYAETVVVDKAGLVLQGARSSSALAQCSADAQPLDPTQEAVVAGRIDLLAPNVELRSFTVQNPAVGSDQPAIYTSPAFSGYQIRDNVIQNSTFGVHLNSSDGKQTAALQNCIRDNNAGFGTVYESGFGVYSDEGLHNALIEGNTFPGTHLERAIAISRPSPTNDPGPPSSDVVIRRNLMVDEGGVILFNTTNSDVAHNRVIRLTDEWTIAGLSNNVVMDHNYFEDGASAAILVLDIRGTGPITNARVEHNEMVRQFFGVVVLGSGGHTIADNLVTSAGRDGILIRAANENVVAGNEVYGSARDGIRADSGSAGNLFEHNRMLGNLEHDAHDTNRVANTWIRNECATDLPAGTICAA